MFIDLVTNYHDSGIAVEQCPRCNGIRKYTGRFEHFVFGHPSHGLVLFVYLNDSWACKSHDPHPSCARIEKRLNLVVQIFFVRSSVRVFDGERWCSADPSRLIGNIAHCHIRRSQSTFRNGVSNVDSDLRDLGIRCDDHCTDDVASSMSRSGGSTINRMPRGQFVAIAIVQLIHTKWSLTR